MNAKLQSKAKLQNKENAHFDFEISTHERDAKIPNRDVHNDLKQKDQTWKQELNQGYPSM